MISINLSVHISCGKLDIEIDEVRDNVLANEQLYLICMGLNIHRPSTNIFSQIQTKYIYHGKLLHLREAKNIRLKCGRGEIGNSAPSSLILVRMTLLHAKLPLLMRTDAVINVNGFEV